MAQEVELIMPKMGESIAEATILKWLKNPGDTIEVDESVLEIATDKVDSEVPSPVTGVISEVLFAEGDVVAVGKVIAKITKGGQGAVSKNIETEVPFVATSNHTTPKATQVSSQEVKPIEVTANNVEGRFYSPLVINIAKSEGISMETLEKISGTGKDNRVTKKDILDYVANGKPSFDSETKVSVAPSVASSKQVESKIEAPKVISTPNVPIYPGDEIVEMDRMRKLIAEHMVMSKHTSPHVTSFVEADVTNMVVWRDKFKKEFEKKHGERITFTPLFINCVVKAIGDYPNINISLSGDSIIKRKAINIGMAAALPSGNLIVPVIKNANTKNLIGLTKDVNDLANRARNNQLKPDDIQGGTFTITNVGTFGNVMGTPIINQPQVAILAIGAIKKKPIVVETPLGDVIAIRHMMFLSLSYDHRIVDGMLGGSFLKKIADYIESFDVNTSF